MTLTYDPDSINVLVLEPDVINVAYRLEELLNRLGYNMELYVSMDEFFRDFENVEADFSKIIMAYNILQNDDLPKLVEDGGLEVACKLITNFNLPPKVISIYSRATGKEYEELTKCCKILGIKYISKFSEQEIEDFLKV